MLEVKVRQALGGFTLDAEFESRGRLTALFGPSGSGKTSIVNAIAGLSRPREARIVADGRVLVDTAERLFVPAHQRRIGYVFQDARLFPHLTVSQNLRYGAWFAPARERYADLNHVVKLLGIGTLLERRPAALSGGEKQRVAIGRALLASPRLILMDEPLASLDEARKAEILPYVECLRDELAIPIVYVSHSLGEVARLASDVVVISEGRVAASGPASAMLQRLDLLPEEERGEGGALLDMAVAAQDETYAMTVLTGLAGELRVPRLEAEVGTPLRVRIRARDVMVATERPRGISALNILEGRVASVQLEEGAAVDVGIDCNGATVLARITRRSLDELGLKAGDQVFAVVKTVSFDRGSTGRG